MNRNCFLKCLSIVLEDDTIIKRNEVHLVNGALSYTKGREIVKEEFRLWDIDMTLEPILNLPESCVLNIPIFNFEIKEEQKGMYIIAIVAVQSGNTNFSESLLVIKKTDNDCLYIVDGSLTVSNFALCYVDNLFESYNILNVSMLYKDNGVALFKQNFFSKDLREQLNKLYQ